MATGRPIIYSGPESDGSNLIRKYVAGLVVPPERPELLAQKVLELRDNRRLYESLASNGLRASPLFSKGKAS